MLFPYAPAYRGPIYEQMDKEFDIDWFFCGNAKRPLKLYDYSRLKNCNLSMREEKVMGVFDVYKGIKTLGLNKYDFIICAPGERKLSIWWLAHYCKNMKSGPKVLFWTHGMYGRENFFQKTIRKYHFSLAHGLLLYNTYSKNLLKKAGFNETRLNVIYNSLDYETQLKLREGSLDSEIYKEHFSNNNHNLVFIGRLTREKRFDLLIEALTLLKEKGESYNVTLIGDGEDREETESLAKQKGVYNAIWFYGACYDEQKNAELIFNADLCVSPGNIGLTAIHSLMFGCPAMTHSDFKHQGPEFEAIQEGITGDFFLSEDVYSLAEKISNWFLNHGNNREQIRKNCYREIDSHWNPDYQIEVLKRAMKIE